MSKSTLIWLIVATALVLLGGIIFCTVMMNYGWSFEKYTTNTYTIDDGFGDISVNTTTADVDFRMSEDGECKIVCYEREKVKHSVKVTNGVLNITEQDGRAWYDYISIFSFETQKITVYLPSSGYCNLKVNVSTGNVDVAKDFRFENINIEGSTGDTKCAASALAEVKLKRSTGNIYFDGFSANSIDISTSTGDVFVSSVGCAGELKVGVSTGNIRMKDLWCGKLTTNGSTGDVDLDNVISRDTFNIKTGTGNVIMKASNAYELFIETSTGDVYGSLLSEKVFLVETGTGDKDLPKTASGGRCVVTTGTGNVKFEIIR